MKPIIILDAFIRDISEEQILLGFLNKMKSINQDIFLISNTELSKEIQEKTNFFFYDKRNRLFESEYTNVNRVYYWIDCGHFVLYDTIENSQKHGLSVLINLNNSVRILKELGYTHFIKMEYDAELGEETLKNISEIINTDKKGIFFKELYNGGLNLNVHFFYSEINFFMENFWMIDSEKTYKDYLIDNMKNLDFLTMERFMWENIDRIDKSDIEIREDFHEIFKDSKWNLKQTKTGHEKKYQECLTKIYTCKKVEYDNVIDLDELVILTRNLKQEPEMRKVIAVYEDDSTQEFIHHVDGLNSWVYNTVSSKLKKIFVYRDSKFLYEEYLMDKNNKIEFK
jgi:hypothetical protein